ncbi:MAG: sugar transferase, partial [Acidobacteria bacterium]|nr:sugar transferase [Acidobacteriota bacterium]
MFWKRLIDVLASAAALALLSPVLAVIAAAVFLDSWLPIFYSQRRVGRGFREFWIWKFRSMCARHSGPPLTAAGDERVTRLGRFLRATKLDELPQFWNVLRGDMSLVGPRPQVPEYVQLFRDRYEKILAVRPGITDLASVQFRNEEAVLAGGADPVGEYLSRVLPAKLDLADEYLRRRSLLLDLSILLRTLMVILAAYSGRPGLLASLENRILHFAGILERFEGFRRLLIRVVHIGLFALSGMAAFLLRFDFRIPPGERSHLLYVVLIWAPVKVMVFRLLRLDHGWWRFVSLADIGRIGAGNLIGSAIGAGLILWLVPPGVPRSIYFLDFLICFLATSGVRMAVRLAAEGVFQGRASGPGRRILIYGAGTAGAMLLREIRSDPKLAYTVCGFLDDNSQKKRLRLQGAPVLGSGADLGRLAQEHKIDEVLIAIPSASGREMIRILEHSHAARVPCKTVPPLADFIEQNSLAKQIREVAVEDLLGRSPVRLDQEQIRARLEGKVVLVTGAAGSIGSELCRQIARFRPRAIVGFENAETALFHLDREMRQSFG